MITRAELRSHDAPARVRFSPNWPDVERLLFDISLANTAPGQTVVVDVGRHHVLLLDHLWPEVMPLHPAIAAAVDRGVHVVFLGRPATASSWWSTFYDLEAAA